MCFNEWISQTCSHKRPICLISATRRKHMLIFLLPFQIHSVSVTICHASIQSFCYHSFKMVKATTLHWPKLLFLHLSLPFVSQVKYSTPVQDHIFESCIKYFYYKIRVTLWFSREMKGFMPCYLHTKVHPVRRYVRTTCISSGSGVWDLQKHSFYLRSYEIT